MAAYFNWVAMDLPIVSNIHQSKKESFQLGGILFPFETAFNRVDPVGTNIVTFSHDPMQ